LFGVNLVGATQYSYTFPTNADFAYLQSKGITFVKLIINWENLQSTLGNTSLNATYLAAIKTAIAAAYAHNIGAIVYLYNDSHYVSTGWGTTYTTGGNAGVTAPGVNVFGDGTLTTADFVDLWTGLSTALVGTPGLIGYGLDNEPRGIIGTNLLVEPNGFGDTGTWGPYNSTGVTSLGTGSNPLSSLYSPAWSLLGNSTYNGIAQFNLSLSAVPYILSLYMQTAQSGGWPLNQLSLNMDYDGISGTSASPSPTTSWTRYATTFVPTAGSHSLQFENDGSNALSIANAQLELAPTTATFTGTIATTVLTASSVTGTIHVGDLVVGAGVTANTTISSQASGTTGGAGTYNLSKSSTVSVGESMTTYSTVPSTYQPSAWLPYAQAAITAIRAIDSSTPIYVQGVGYSSAYGWPWANGELITLTGGNLVFEAHQYFDVAPPGEGSGSYSGTYTSYGVTATSGVTEVTPFVQWLQATGQKGYLGEFGVPNLTTDNDAQWLVLQQNVEQYLVQNSIPSSMWFYENNGTQLSNILNIATSTTANAGNDDPRLIQMLEQY